MEFDILPYKTIGAFPLDVFSKKCSKDQVDQYKEGQNLNGQKTSISSGSVKFVS